LNLSNPSARRRRMYVCMHLLQTVQQAASRPVFMAYAYEGWPPSSPWQHPK
jgi:hypothetical protein